MKKVLLISKNKRVIEAFSAIKKSPSCAFEVRSRKTGVKCSADTLCYIDVSGMQPDELERNIAEHMGKIHPWGLIDYEGSIEDVGSLFHLGVCDYINLKDGKKLKVRRIQQVFDFHSNHSSLSAGTMKKVPVRIKPSKPLAEYALSWSKVKSGKTYTFCIMYIEMLPSTEVSGKSGAAYKEQMQTAFQNMISQQIGPYNGKVWMWNDWGGLVLFPSDGKNCDTLIMAMRLLINRVPLSMENGPFNSILSFRLALHIGTTGYKVRGQTGTIVSDDINFIFHLGKNKLEPGHLYLTDSFFPHLSENMRLLFKDQGVFEEHRVYRMTSPYGSGT